MLDFRCKCLDPLRNLHQRAVMAARGRSRNDGCALPQHFKFCESGGGALGSSTRFRERFPFACLGSPQFVSRRRLAALGKSDRGAE